MNLVYELTQGVMASNGIPIAVLQENHLLDDAKKLIETGLARLDECPKNGQLLKALPALFQRGQTH